MIEYIRINGYLPVVRLVHIDSMDYGDIWFSEYPE